MSSVSLQVLKPVMEIYYANNKDISLTAEESQLSVETVSRYFRTLRSKYPSEYAKLEENFNEILTDDNKNLLVSNVRYKKDKQKAQDINRVERKSFRESARVENAIEEYGKEIKDLLSKHNSSLQKVTISHPKKKKEKKVGIAHLSDLHLNELVNLPNNKFDFTVASQRLQKYVSKIKSLFKSNDIKTVVLCITGDLLNSDRRLDELLNQSVNRAKASVLATYILKMVILDLNKDFNVKVVGVVGNEGRMKEEMTWSDSTLTDSYDYTIMAHLSLLFRGAKGIEFGRVDKVEQVVDVLDKKILLTHGARFGASPQSNIIKTQARYASKGVILDYVLFGHIHNAMISDDYGRNASLVGSNSYNENSLNLISNASQNCYVVEEDAIYGTRIDLQNSDGYDGYPIIKELQASEQKSVEKTKENHTLFKVII